MAVPSPLSHHQILERLGPFSRRGWAIDLAASDRAARRLAFRAREHAAAGTLPALTETWQLDVGEDGAPFTLSRTLAPAAGYAGATEAGGAARVHAAAATLVAEGDDLDALIERVEACPRERQFITAGGTLAALALRLQADGHLALRGAEARVAGLTLRLKASRVQGFPAEIELLRDEGDARMLPEDLLAVLGRPWERLTAVRRGWVSAVALRGAEPRRSRDARERLATTLGHLARTLAEPPARFHERHRAARWRYALRGTLPLAVGVAMVALAFWVQGLGERYASYLALLANAAPPLLMGLFFLRREMPRVGLPRPPRRPGRDAWAPHG
jgi:hypothetical protein